MGGFQSEASALSETVMGAHPGWVGTGDNTATSDVATPSSAGELTTTTTTTSTTTRTGGGTCNLATAIGPPQCCMQMWCAPLPAIGAIADHCWIEVTDCYGKTDRYEVWQNENDIPAAKKLGKHTAKNLNPPGAGVGAGGAREVCDKVCKDCEPLLDELCMGSEDLVIWVGCECVEEAAKSYPDKDVYTLPGPNSNTFAQAMADKCGLNCKLPPSAIGSDYRPGLAGVAEASVQGCQLHGRLGYQGYSIGVSAGLSGAYVQLLGAPIGISSQGIHCLITIPWPF